MELIKAKNPDYNMLAKELLFEDDEIMIKYFQEYTN